MNRPVVIRPRAVIALLTPLTLTGPVAAQQRGNADFDPTVHSPASAPAEGPRILFDNAHDNFHTSDGRYQPFVRLMLADGFRVTSNDAPFSRESLAGHDILVISSARGAPPGEPGQADPAFTAAEVEAVHEWVRGGGALLLVTDHPPAATPPAALAERFGISLIDAAPRDTLHIWDGTGQLVFNRAVGTLGDHPITRGRTADERVRRVITFTGNSFVPPPEAAVLLRLPRTAVEGYDRPAAGDTAVDVFVPARGTAQGLALTFGRGRVVALGEAAAWTSQNFGEGTEVTGMDEPGFDNRRFILNVMRWLGGLLPASAVVLPAPDTAFDPALARPMFDDAGPRVAFDGGHHNLFTGAGRFAPLAGLLSADGYRIASLDGPSSPAALRDVDVLVIGGPRARDIECRTAVQWVGPADCPAARPAFAESEIATIRHWVRGGGALLLALDPFPSGSAARDLARAFGVEVTGGHALDWVHREGPGISWVSFEADSGTIAEHPVTRAVRRVLVLTSTSLSAPVTGSGPAAPAPIPLLTFATPAVEQLPFRASADTLELRTVPIDGRAVALVLPFGRGRVAVLGDADMLTSQIFDGVDGPVGLDAPRGYDNRRFTRQLFRWLAGRTEER